MHRVDVDLSDVTDDQIDGFYASLVANAALDDVHIAWNPDKGRLAVLASVPEDLVAVAVSGAVKKALTESGLSET